MPQFTTTNVEESWINSASATSNNDGIQVGELNSGTSVRRTLIQADLSSIPTTATVTAASLTLTISSDFSDNARTISAYRVLRNWVEAEVTWNVYSTGNNWGTAGCANTTTDRESAAAGTGTQPNASSGTVVITLTPSLVQEMISGALTNNGWLLQVATEADDLIVYSACQVDITYTLIAGTSTITGTAVVSAASVLTTPLYAVATPKFSYSTDRAQS